MPAVTITTSNVSSLEAQYGEVFAQSLLTIIPFISVFADCS